MLLTFKNFYKITIYLKKRKIKKAFLLLFSSGLARGIQVRNMVTLSGTEETLSYTEKTYNDVPANLLILSCYWGGGITNAAERRTLSYTEKTPCNSVSPL